MPKMMTVSQSREMASRIVRLLPDDLESDHAQALNDAPSEVIHDFLAGLKSLPVLFPLPEQGVEFELTLDGDATDPLQMVKDDGYDPTDWKFNGPKVVGKQTQKFKLASFHCTPGKYYQFKLYDMEDQIGPLAEGEWREAFRRRFQPSLGVLVGFGGFEWRRSSERIRLFPCLHGGRKGWEPYFGWEGMIEKWPGLWLVPSK